MAFNHSDVAYNEKAKAYRVLQSEVDAGGALHFACRDYDPRRKLVVGDVDHVVVETRNPAVSDVSIQINPTFVHIFVISQLA